LRPEDAGEQRSAQTQPRTRTQESSAIQHRLLSLAQHKRAIVIRHAFAMTVLGARIEMLVRQPEGQMSSGK
jgi:hypothetical protein